MILALERLLARLGPTKGPVLAKNLGISQPTLSRLIRENKKRILIVGKARATTYALRRSIPDVAAPISVSEIRGPQQDPRLLFQLHPIEPRGFYASAVDSGEASRFYEDLPYFLQDLRPAGFLGRLVPHQHPNLRAPDDIRLWNSDHVLRYLTSEGWNLSGAMIVGDAAYQRFLENVGATPDVIGIDERSNEYPRLAADALRNPVGSSAAGEQPKFAVAIRREASVTPVLVKFSPPIGDSISARVADLLVAEHIAHKILKKYGRPTVESEIIREADRVFLELERFDRVGYTHRRGLLTLSSLDAEFVGGARTRWTSSTLELLNAGVISQADHDATRWLELFGELIANTDMHFGNLSFYLDGTHLVGLAPAYDMVSMAYRPREGELVDVIFSPQIPGPSAADIARDVWAAAIDYWSEVSLDALISKQFRQIASKNARSLKDRQADLALLPNGASGTRV